LLYSESSKKFPLSTMSALGVSFAPQLKQSKTLYKWIKPLANKYAEMAGYRTFAPSSFVAAYPGTDRLCYGTHILGQHGLRYDDIIIEENPTVQKVGRRVGDFESVLSFFSTRGYVADTTQALSRLSEKEKYDRMFRHRVAIQCSILHRELPKDKHLPPQDVSVANPPLSLFPDVTRG
jgi:ubiquinol-cytochrome c reductase subunit 7